MIFLFFLSAFFFFSCGGAEEKIREEALSPDLPESEEAGNVLCKEKSFYYQKPALPEKVEEKFFQKYRNGEVCSELPEPQNGFLFLGEGCFSGCLKVDKNLKIIGVGSGKSEIYCGDEKKDGVIELSPYSTLILENISLSGASRCIFGENGSVVNIKNSVLSNCSKGGIMLCHDEIGCYNELFIEDSFVGDIKEAVNGVSYGISFGNGILSISNSEIGGVNSFAVAIWGEEGKTSDVNIENSIISGVYGGLRSYEGHCIYGEEVQNMTIRNSEISDCAASFVFVSSEKNDTDLHLVDFTAQNILETGEEQGGIVLDGNIKADFERVLIEKSRGNGIFLRNSKIYSEDLTIESVFSDGLGDNGFGLQIVDGTEGFFKRFFLKSAEKAGVILDGNTNAEIEDFEIISTKSDGYTKEFGVGAGLQNGSSLILKNGLMNDNRESGILVIGSEISLENVEIKNTKGRECSEEHKCLFAPDSDFGHGISLYSGSSLYFNSLSIFNNNNALNIENSEVFGFGEKRVFFGLNTTAVNAWNISDLNKLEENLSNSEFCGNESVLTTDHQPVRESF